MRAALAFGLLLALATPARGHMVVEPASSAAGGPQRYTLVVPTEGASATVRVELRLPMGMDVVALEAKPGWEASNNPFPVGAATLRWSGGRIPPGQMTTFEFLATNPPAARTLEWNAAQWFEDGTSERWGQGGPADHAASTTTLVAAAAAGDAGGVAATGTPAALWIVALASCALAVAALLAALSGRRAASRP